MSNLLNIHVSWFSSPFFHVFHLYTRHFQHISNLQPLELAVMFLASSLQDPPNPKTCEFAIEHIRYAVCLFNSIYVYTCHLFNWRLCSYQESVTSNLGKPKSETSRKSWEDHRKTLIVLWTMAVQLTRGQENTCTLHTARDRFLFYLKSRVSFAFALKSLLYLHFWQIHFLSVFSWKPYFLFTSLLVYESLLFKCWHTCLCKATHNVSSSYL